MTEMYDFHSTAFMKQVGQCVSFFKNKLYVLRVKEWATPSHYNSGLPLQHLTKLLYFFKTSQKQTGNTEKKKKKEVNNDWLNLKDT